MKAGEERTVIFEAGGHSLGTANLVKANVLAEFLESRVLPGLLP